MSKGTLVQIVAIVLALAAAKISYHLLSKHMSDAAGPAWFEAGCSGKAEAHSANCKAVLESPYSYFPKKTSDRPDGKIHLPVAFVGLVYYSMLAAWLLAIGRPSPDRRWVHLFPLILMVFGLAGSCYFVYLMFSVMKHWCPWCLVTHSLNAMIAVCVILLWPGRGSTQSKKNQISARAQANHSGKADKPVPPLKRDKTSLGAQPHPSFHLTLVACVMIVVLLFGELSLLGLNTWKTQADAATGGFNKCMENLKRITVDGTALFNSWRLNPKHEIKVRSDDPVRTKGTVAKQLLPVVVFGDFQCPSCKRASAFLEKTVQSFFEGNLSIVFKHYPLHHDCNERTTTELHPHACEAARWAEGARLLGGNDAFWKAHDYLYENQQRLAHGEMTLDEVARTIGVKPQALRDAAKNPTVTQRMQEDVVEAGKCDVIGTPAIFVLGKWVDRLAVLNPAFWDQLADVYWLSRHVPRPDSTKRAKTDATPGNQDH